ncbi:ATP-grasp domain-containing protein [Shewanella sp. VB17]|nr:ATP-grasp domain-containing protein [Shewanella sp. VB17]
MNKSLIIIGAGIEACEGIKIAKEMGLKLIIIDGDPIAPGFKFADISLIISTYDGKEITNKALALKNRGIVIDGVIAMCSDVPLSVANVTDKLNLPGLSIKSASLVADKLLMKERLQQMGIPIPHFSAVNSLDSLKALALDWGYPFIIKPVDSRGARGVQLIESGCQLEQAFIQAYNESPTQRVMIEEYLIGPQISTETLIENSNCYTLGFSDRNYEWLLRTKPQIIENGGDSPSKLSQDEQQQVTATVEAAALALGITQGVAKGDMVLTPDGAKVIEIAGRLSGGYFSTTQIPLATGVNFVEQAIKLALGEPLNIEHLTPSRLQGVAIRYLDLKPGVVERVLNLDKAATSKGVEMLSTFIKPGDTISSLTSHTQRSGFVICTGTSKEEAVYRAQKALAHITVEYSHE